MILEAILNADNLASDLKTSRIHGLFIEKLQRQAYPLFD